jgi:hypothetical protein
MDRIFIILGWIVMTSLSLAIARQLSEQTFVFRGGLLENFTVQTSANNSLLLSDVLEVKKEPGTLNSKQCYDADFMSHTQLSGDYTQRTNNFKHGNPDNCSAPLTEFVNSIYE